MEVQMDTEACVLCAHHYSEHTTHRQTKLHALSWGEGEGRESSRGIPCSAIICARPWGRRREGRERRTEERERALQKPKGIPILSGIEVTHLFPGGLGKDGTGEHTDRLQSFAAVAPVAESFTRKNNTLFLGVRGHPHFPGPYVPLT